jgi:hypothetical protein
MMSTELPDGHFLQPINPSIFSITNLAFRPPIPVSLRRRCRPARQGPFRLLHWGKRPLWTPSGLRAWAAARLRSVRLEPTAAPEAASKFPTSKRLLTPGPTPKRMPEMNRPGAVTRPQPRPSAEQS